MKLLRLADACAVTGLRRSPLYDAIKRGLLPRPVTIGGRSVAWPDMELEAINRARVAGKTDNDIRTLVAQLEAARANADKVAVNRAEP